MGHQRKQTHKSQRYLAKLLKLLELSKKVANHMSFFLPFLPRENIHTFSICSPLVLSISLLLIRRMQQSLTCQIVFTEDLCILWLLPVLELETQMIFFFHFCNVFIVRHHFTLGVMTEKILTMPTQVGSSNTKATWALWSVFAQFIPASVPYFFSPLIFLHTQQSSVLKFLCMEAVRKTNMEGSTLQIAQRKLSTMAIDFYKLDLCLKHSCFLLCNSDEQLCAANFCWLYIFVLYVQWISIAR